MIKLIVSIISVAITLSAVLFILLLIPDTKAEFRSIDSLDAATDYIASVHDETTEVIDELYEQASDEYTTASAAIKNTCERLSEKNLWLCDIFD